MHACTVICVWRPVGNLGELVSSSYHMCSGDLSWVVRLEASTFTYWATSTALHLSKNIYLYVGVGLIHTPCDGQRTNWRSQFRDWTQVIRLGRHLSLLAHLVDPSLFFWDQLVGWQDSECQRPTCFHSSITQLLHGCCKRIWTRVLLLCGRHFTDWAHSVLYCVFSHLHLSTCEDTTTFHVKYAGSRYSISLI